MESQKEEDKEIARQLLELILPKSGNSIRIGVTGIPGVGKSTFIETLGINYANSGKKVAVLSVDPSSSRSGGSILGDKTRMNELSAHPDAFIRPSPSGTHLGGVSLRTRESIYLCEAAGYDIIIVETVGTGQSESAVKDMTDIFLLLTMAGTGDDLQGIKRGIMEMADLLLVNKSDGQNKKESEKYAISLKNIMQLFTESIPGWKTVVMNISSKEITGINEVMTQISKYCNLSRETGYFEKNRNHQNLKWFRDLLHESLINHYLKKSDNELKIKQIESSIATGELSIRGALKKLKL